MNSDLAMRVGPVVSTRPARRAALAAATVVLGAALMVIVPASASHGADTTAPGAPTGLSGWWRSGAVSMSWEAPDSDGGAEITRYEYRYAAGDASPADTWTSVGTGTEVTAEGLTNGVAHRFEVRAANSAGVGVASAFEVMPLALRDGDIQMVPESSGGPVPSYGPIEVYFDGKWGKVCDDYFYDIGNNAAAVACRQLGYTDGAAIDGPNHRLLPDHEYVMDDVRCDGCENRLTDCQYRGDGHNCFSVEVINIDCDVSGLGPPRSVLFVPGTGQGTLAWNPPASDAGSPVVRYEYRYRAANSDFGEWTDAGLNLMATMDNPPDGVRYRFEVRATNADGAESAASIGTAAITGFTLIDADTDAELTALFGGENVALGADAARPLTIRANTARGPQSVVLALSGQQSLQRTEGLKPYTLHGDSFWAVGRTTWRRFDGDSYVDYEGGILTAGDYTLTATAYSGDNGSDTVLDSLTVSFSKSDPDHVPPLPQQDLTAEEQNSTALQESGTQQSGNQLAQVPDSSIFAGFSLIAGGSAEVLQALVDGGEVAMGDFDADSFAIRADIATGETVGSVGLSLTQGTDIRTRTESWAPYSMYGDYGHDNLDGDSLPAGNWQLTATAYAQMSLQGDVLGSLTVSFTVVEQQPPIQDQQQPNAPAINLDGASVTALPLTASFDSVPSTHDGSTSFTFELHFSEEFALSYLVLRDDAFTVSGGTVTRVKRLEQGVDSKRQIHVQPHGNGDVTLVLPVTIDCTAEGAICTGVGKPLSNRLELVVSGPP